MEYSIMLDLRKTSPSKKISSFTQNQIGSQQNPATSGVQILNAGLPSGDYWIKPTSYNGLAKLLYVDNTNQGGGWILVAKGRESDNPLGWWDNASFNEFALVNSLRSTIPVARVDSNFVNAVFGGSGWTANSRFLVNRAEVADSWRYLLPVGRTFAWTDFGGAQNVFTSPVNATSGSRWSSQWWSGTENVATNFNYWDWYATGGNDATRIFSAWWSGHGNFRGWSAGSTVTSGFQVGSEAHAIQTVQIYVK